MAIKLSPEELRGQADQMTSLMNSYDSLFKSVTGTLNSVNGNWSEYLSNNFTGKISSAQKSFSAILNSLEFGASSATLSANTFEDIDTVLANNLDGAAASSGNASASDEDTNMVGDILGFLDKILGAGGDSSGALSPITGFLKALYDIYHEADSKDTVLLPSLLEFIFKGFDKGAKVIGTIGDKEKWGIVSALFGITAVGVSYFSDPSSDGLIKNTDNLWKAGTKLVKAVSGISQKVFTEITGVATATTYLVGDIIKYSTDDHPITPYEIADIFGDVGLNTGNSLIQGLTFGIISIDVDNMTATINSNTEAVADYISDMNIPDPLKVVAAAASSPFTATYSVVKSVSPTEFADAQERNGEALADWLSDTGLPVEAQVALDVVASPFVSVYSAIEAGNEITDKVQNSIESGIKGVIDWFN